MNDSKEKWEVLVSNVGFVSSDNDTEAEARACYTAYRDLSRKGVGRVAGESVTLFSNGFPVLIYEGKAHQ